VRSLPEHEEVARKEIGKPTSSYLESRNCSLTSSEAEGEGYLRSVTKQKGGDCEKRCFRKDVVEGGRHVRFSEGSPKKRNMKGNFHKESSQAEIT